MRIAIDLPAKRSLTPNEQRVYKLLQEGLEPPEIARRLHMALKISNLANIHDIPPDTVLGLMASIREKGWEIPASCKQVTGKLNTNKEENNMAKGQKTPVEKIHELSALRDEGKSQNKIAEITGIPLSTVGKICARIGKAEIKEEPAPSANDTSSKKETSTTTIVPEIPADVNTISENSRTFSEYSKTAMLWCIRQKEAELEKLKIEICCMKADYVELMGGQLGKEVRQ